MKEFNKQNARELSDAFMNALKPLEKKFGVKITYKGGRYTSSNVTFKIEAATVSTDGRVMDKESQDFVLMADYYGMKGTWINQEFTLSGNKYKVVGLRTRCHKTPVIIERADGKRFKVRTTDVIQAFQNKKTA